MTEKIAARDIVDALYAANEDKICCEELELLNGSRRVDFWTLDVTASARFRAVSYEIKISIQDFKRDTEAKQARALEISDRFFYVAPKGLLSKAVIPDWAGLMEFDGKLLTVAKLAPRLPEKRNPDWLLIVSIIRNSRQCRRDVGLLKSQLAYFKWRDERDNVWNSLRNERLYARLQRLATRESHEA